MGIGCRGYRALGVAHHLIQPRTPNKLGHLYFAHSISTGKFGKIAIPLESSFSNYFMGNAVKILVVEDEMIIGAKILMQLEMLGYEVTGILPRGEEVLAHLKENKPDIILLDIQLKGKMDGINRIAF